MESPIGSMNLGPYYDRFNAWLGFWIRNDDTNLLSWQQNSIFFFFFFLLVNYRMVSFWYPTCLIPSFAPFHHQTLLVATENKNACAN